jgi:hypothetical protein
VTQGIGPEFKPQYHTHSKTLNFITNEMPESMFLAACSLITTSFEDEFEIQSSGEVIDDLVFPPACCSK